MSDTPYQPGRSKRDKKRVVNILLHLEQGLRSFYRRVHLLARRLRFPAPAVPNQHLDRRRLESRHGSLDSVFLDLWAFCAEAFRECSTEEAGVAGTKLLLRVAMFWCARSTRNWQDLILN